jgi:signal peptidase
MGTFVGEALLSIAAAGGVVCILALIAAVGFNISLVMFATGSMAPTIPAGSLAIVKELAAADIRAGDVVTVDRVGALPITHRVTAIAPVSDKARAISMRGDANPVDDPKPYILTRARIVLFSVPGLAQPLVVLSQPAVMGGTVISVATLVTWAFWPRMNELRIPKHRAARTR